MAEPGMRLAEVGEWAVGLIERQDWLDRVGRALGGAVAAALEAKAAGRRVRNFLHGTWLGHPLHPVLTDVPVGAWTAAAVMDVMDRQRYAAGADAAIRVGLAGAVAAAAAGLADWHHTASGARRVGLVHGLLNTVALGTYVGSLALRRAGRRDAGRGLSMLGFGVLLVSAYLGGTLVYRHRLGVDHSEHPALTPEFLPVLREAELPEGQPRRADAGGTRVVLVRRHGQVHALAEVCTHLGGPLAEGRIEDGAIVCPWHGSRFSLADGRVLDGPATAPQPCFETRVRDGMIEVRAAAAAPLAA